MNAIAAFMALMSLLVLASAVPVNKQRVESNMDQLDQPMMDLKESDLKLETLANNQGGFQPAFKFNNQNNMKMMGGSDELAKQQRDKKWWGLYGLYGYPYYSSYGLYGYPYYGYGYGYGMYWG
jgi:hypothetical protein